MSNFNAPPSPKSKPKVILEDLPKIKEIFETGPNKPLSYIPLEYVKNELGVSVGELVEVLEQRDLKTVVLDKKDIEIDSGALFIYDEHTLQSKLYENKEMLEKYSFTTDPLDFIKKIATQTWSQQDLFDFIADTFGDKTNPLRSEFGGYKME